MRARHAVTVPTCVTLVVASVSFGIGQEKKVPPVHQVAVPADSTQGKGASKLPKIELPEFVITGKEPVDLPEVSKSSADEPLVNKPSGGMVNPGVRESGFAGFGDLQKSQAGFSSLGNGYNGKAEVGYGTYATPYFDASFGNSYPSADFLLKAGYKSSGGHVPNADYRAGYASLVGGTHLGDDAGDFSENRVQAIVAMRGNSYRLYGSTNPTLQRTVTGFDAGLSMMSSNPAMIPYSASFNMESSSLKDFARTAETSLGAQLDVTNEVEDWELKGSAGLWKSFYSAQSVTEDPFYTKFAGSASYRLAGGLDIRGGLAFFLYRGSDTRTSGRLYPQLGVSWYASDRLTVYAKFEPSVQRASLSTLAESSPYIVADVVLRHPSQFTNFSLGAEAEVNKGVQSRISLNYSRTDDVPVFVDLDSSGVWDVVYSGTTRILSLDGELYADLSEADNLGASVAIRSNKNSTTGSRNPYFASFVSSVSYQHRFDLGLTLGGLFRIEGSRSVDLADTRTLPAFVVLNLNAEYMILPRWSLMFSLNDLFNEEQTMWEGYVGLRRTVSLGTSFVW